MKIFFLHFKCVPAEQTNEIQGGYAETCVICTTADEAEALSRSLILSHSYIVEELLACAETTNDKLHEMDEIELTLYLKAQQRDPKCSVLLSVCGEGRPDAKFVSLGVPKMNEKPN